MRFTKKTSQRIVTIAAILMTAVMFGYASGLQPAFLGKASTAAWSRASWARGSANRGGSLPKTLVQAQTSPGQTQEPEATSAASADATSADATSSASSGDEEKNAAYCLKCHGPFEELVKRTENYVTEWDEKANPHMYVPHDTATIVECAECHDPHAIPYEPTADARKPNVNYCYSCHHAETLVHCNQCHTEWE